MRHRQRQQEHVAVAEVPLGREQLLADLGADRAWRRSCPRRTTPVTTTTRRTMPGAEVVVLAFARRGGRAWAAARPGSPGRPGAGMRAMKMPVMKPAVIVLRSAGVARICTPRTLMYESSWAKIEPTSKQPERARELGVRRVGPRRHEAVLAAERDAHRDDRRQRERDAVPARRGRRDGDEHERRR